MCFVDQTQHGDRAAVLDAEQRRRRLPAALLIARVRADFRSTRRICRCLPGRRSGQTKLTPADDDAQTIFWMFLHPLNALLGNDVMSGEI